MAHETSIFGTPLTGKQGTAQDQALVDRMAKLRRGVTDPIVNPILEALSGIPTALQERGSLFGPTGLSEGLAGIQGFLAEAEERSEQIKGIPGRALSGAAGLISPELQALVGGQGPMQGPVEASGILGGQRGPVPDLAPASGLTGALSSSITTQGTPLNLQGFTAEQIGDFDRSSIDAAIAQLGELGQTPGARGFGDRFGDFLGGGASALSRVDPASAGAGGQALLALGAGGLGGLRTGAARQTELENRAKELRAFSGRQASQLDLTAQQSQNAITQQNNENLRAEIAVANDNATKRATFGAPSVQQTAIGPLVVTRNPDTGITETELIVMPELLALHMSKVGNIDSGTIELPDGSKVPLTPADRALALEANRLPFETKVQLQPAVDDMMANVLERSPLLKTDQEEFQKKQEQVKFSVYTDFVRQGLEGE